MRKDSRAKLIVSKGARNKIAPGDGDTMMETSTTDSSTAPQLPDRGQRVTVETVTVKDNKEYDADLESEDKEDDGGSGVYWSISDFHKLWLHTRPVSVVVHVINLSLSMFCLLIQVLCP